MVLITKGNGYLRGIGLVDVLWNMETGHLNRNLTTAIGFYDILHGFLAGWGTDTAYLKENMLQ